MIHLTWVPTEWIVRRSGGLFWLTSALNSATLVLAGLLLGAGVGGPYAFTLTMLPALLAIVATLAVAGLPRILRSRPRAPRWLGAISAGVRDAEQTTFQYPSWRLAGALGYLWFDMAVLWIILKGVGEPISVPALVLAYSIGYLADTLPIPPGLGGTLAYIRLRSRLTPPRSRPARSLDVPGRTHLIEGNQHDLPSARPAPDPPRLGHLSDRRPVDRALPRAGRPGPSAALPHADRQDQ
ncbi:MAG: hypothetical protein JO262_17980 [Solirubrobacterales bacterium]|nr:hypothetical protein [Solirubrobacterales bacterium]